MQRVYLDHAATSWPKPPGVVEALVDYQNRCGVAAGRGAYASAVEASAIVVRLRQKIAKAIGASSPDEIVFTHNGTSALNLALSALLLAGDHVVTTAAEHNSLLRPLAWLRQSRSIDVSIVKSSPDGFVDPDEIANAMSSRTRLIALSHASNVTGRIQPIAAIGEIARRNSSLLLLDAAQTFGYLPIDVLDSNIDFLASPGHKGGCGMLGTGFLFARRELTSRMQVPWPGGTGSESEKIEGPYAWPGGAEAGNLNVPALAAWSCGLDWLASHKNDEQLALTESMRLRLVRILRQSSLGTVIGSHESGKFLPVVSLRCQEIPCSDLAALLDSTFRIEVRSGLHCAGKIHSDLGTADCGGTLRFSLGHTSTENDLDRLEEACRVLKASGVQG